MTLKLINSIRKLFSIETIAEVKEPNYTLRIYQKPRERVLTYITPSAATIFSKLKNNSIYTHSYWDYFMPLPALYKSPKVLVIGLGGGTIPYQLEKLYSNISIDAVEIDPNMIALSRQFLPERLRANLINADGIEYIKSTPNTYSLIILDAFHKHLEIPKAFFSDEFIDNANRALSEIGILAINYAFTIGNSIEFNSQLSKLKKYFSVSILRPSNLSGNYIIICSKHFTKEQLIRIAAERFGSREALHISKGYVRMR